jgi:hypothetical protein
MTQENVIARLKELGLKLNIAGKEANLLHTVLKEDEIIIAGYEGNLQGGGSGILIATNKRIFFFDKGMFGGISIKDFIYDKISSIEADRGMMMSSIKIFVGNIKSEIKGVEKELTTKFVDAVNEVLLKKSQPVLSNIDVADQIAKLAKLKEQGILTEEEFKAQKSKLLA